METEASVVDDGKMEKMNSVTDLLRRGNDRPPSDLIFLGARVFFVCMYILMYVYIDMTERVPIMLLAETVEVAGRFVIWTRAPTYPTQSLIE